MMLSVDDLLTDADLEALDKDVFSNFGEQAAAGLADKRRVAVQDFVQTRLEKEGYLPIFHLSRRAPDKVYQYTGAVFTDRSAAMSDKTADDLDAADVFVTPASDAIYVGLDRPFKGLWVGMLDAVNATASILDVEYWDGGQWKDVESLVDETQIADLKSLSGGGGLRWVMPANWRKRTGIGGETVEWRYWVKVKMSATPSAGSTLTHLLPILRSRLTRPAAYHALGLLYLENWGVSSTTEWREKGEKYLKMAEDELMQILPLVKDEFDVDESQAIEPEEPGQVIITTRDPFTMERG
jgi:hypothetical protein